MPILGSKHGKKLKKLNKRIYDNYSQSSSFHHTEKHCYSFCWYSLSLTDFTWDCSKVFVFVVVFVFVFIFAFFFVPPELSRSVSLALSLQKNHIYNIYIDILQHRVPMPSLTLWKLSLFFVFVFVFVFVCVFVIVNMCQEAVSIINYPQIYNRLGFWP